MIEPGWLLWGVLLPFVIASIAVAAGAVDRPWARCAAVLGIVLAAGVGMLALTGLPPWQPLVGPHWVLMAVVPAALTVALLGMARPVPAWVGWALRLILACTIAPLLTRPLVPYTWSQSQALGWWIGLPVWITALWFCMRTLALRHSPRLTVFALGGACGVLGAVTAASGYLAGGQYALSLAFVWLAVWIVMLVRPKTATLGPVVVDLAVPLFAGWLVYNWQFGWTMQNAASPFIVAGLLAVAPLGVWVGRVPAIRKRSPRLGLAAAVIACVLMLLGALGLAGYEARLRVNSAPAHGYGY